MAFKNPKGRVNYEPNSWGSQDGVRGGPRETPNGFQSYPEDMEGDKRRARSSSFADHYSQARQFYLSQTEIERRHIAAAFAFELGKVETPAIRLRMLANLLNVDEELVQEIATKLGLKDLPQPAEAALPTNRDLKASSALSILKNGPGNFQGRRLGVLATDGADSELIDTLEKAAEQEGADCELVTPTIGGIHAANGTLYTGDGALAGTPSVLFDAVAIVVSREGAAELAKDPAARDFIADAVAHKKFIAYSPEAQPLLLKASGLDALDQGFIALDGSAEVVTFLETCRALRYWDRP